MDTLDGNDIENLKTKQFSIESIIHRSRDLFVELNNVQIDYSIKIHNTPYIVIKDPNETIPLNLKYNKIIGMGYAGVVIKVGNFAIKSTRLQNKHANIDNEIKFSLSFGNDHPTRFMQFYAYRVLHDPNFLIPTTELSNLPYSVRSHTIERDSGQFVLQRVYSYARPYTDISRNGILSQKDILYILDTINMMNDAGYTHRDLHLGNIAYYKNYPIIIDFDFIVHKNDRPDIEQHKVWRKYNDFLDFYRYVVSSRDFDIVISNLPTNKRKNIAKWNNFMLCIKRTQEFEIVKKKWTSELINTDYCDNDIALLLFALYPTQHKKCMNIEGRNYSAISHIDLDYLINFYYACLTQNYEIIKKIIILAYKTPNA